MNITDSTSSADQIELLILQLSEIEMLTSMYPSENEFKITLPSIVADMNRYIDRKTSTIPNELDFILNLNIPDINDKFEVYVNYPHRYPTERPSISCRATGLSRNQQKELNSAVRTYINELPDGELCIISIINWLLENGSNYFSLMPAEIDQDSANDDVPSPQKETLCRMWIYSHHIYNKFKRREIVDSAQDLKLTGFSLPGKPGFICIEGTKRNCNDFLQNLKQMSWKKISLVREETDDSNTLDFLKFDKFQEISFQVRRGPAKEYHMDMGQFLKYLEEHDCTYAFNDLFGLEGHVGAVK